MTEDYAEKMTRKTDAELERYIGSRAEYRDDAVLAALDELARRGHPHPDAAQLRPKLEAGVREQQVRLDAEDQRIGTLYESTEVVEAEETGPRLYSPITITWFSVLFSMLAGGVLLGLNLRQLGRTGGLVRLVLFVLLYFVGGMLALSWLVQRYGMSTWLLSLFDLPAIIAYIFWFWPRYVRTYTYQTRNWLIPFAICAVLKIGLLVLAAQQLSKLMGSLPMH
ncbi:hypothetical protein [Hymenobacter cavernae]|uniref:DUF2157 domain-containing protein n=1 Tax=Hymenobacter cavernae TaxID=2044852 RepID=A0ABQ1TVA8_9BACT|nr:hypothetical protein [Hymenobacter cavernae]GGF04647.1 hypothetical protein GCM10011383_14700 [Hymenobacter cavernae]